MAKIIDTEFKYRPKSLNEFVYPNERVQEAAMAYGSGGVTRPLILCGTFGTGKSLLAELIPRAIEGGIAPSINRMRAHELNSQKELWNHFGSNKHFNNLFTTGDQRFNYHIINELNFDPKARNTLRELFDEQRGTDLVIITTNEIDKIDDGIRDRCEVLSVPPCDPRTFLPRALQIISAENHNVDSHALLQLLEGVFARTPSNRAYYKTLDELLRKL